MLALGSKSNEISFGGIPADDCAHYVSSFGKIYFGEKLRVLFTLMNVSDKHQLQNVRLLIKLKCQ